MNKLISTLLVLVLTSMPIMALPVLGELDYWQENSPMDDQTFLSEGYSAVDNSSQGRRSIYVWDKYLLNGGAFPALSEVLMQLGIDRVYQYTSRSILQRQELPDMVSRLSAQGIQTVALMGDTEWLEDGLEEYKALIDALYEYNQAHPEEKIPAVALDVEAHTLKSFRRDPSAGFAAYIQCMEEACQYAHERDLRVIQVIPTRLDTIDRDQFEEFLDRCCDEISLMNYQKDTELDAIWNEVTICRVKGIPVESVFETMPLSEKYDVTEDITYYYDGAEALAGAVEEIQGVYGSSLSIGYHHLETIYHVQTGLYLANIYPYATHSSDGDENGQIRAGERLWLRGPDGTMVPAWLSSPDSSSKHSEYSYLAVGVQVDVPYSVILEDENYRVTTRRSLIFEAEPDKVVYAESFHAEPNPGTPGAG